jgi:carboxy-terminal domain RNA polymerase II polypeptide A small phosphatase
MNESNKLLILDLDETLIYASEEPLSKPFDLKLDRYFIYKRPGLENFLLQCFKKFRLAIWTASSTDYACQVIKEIFPEEVKLEFVFTNERCLFRFNLETGDQEIIKPLKKVQKKGYSLNNIIVVDDLKETFQRNYGNAILVSKYFGDMEDKELHLLLEYLNILHNVDDVRKIEKRYWKDKIK